MKKTKINFIFTKEMAKLLKKVREKSNLSQVEIAKRIGFVPKSGKIYISCLENGKILPHIRLLPVNLIGY